MKRRLLREDIYADVETRTETIKLDVTMEKGEGSDCDYDVSIDEQTKQVVITPRSSKASFVKVDGITASSYIESDNSTQESFEIDLTVNMLSDTDEFGYVTDIDTIGQIIVTPKSDKTEFVSASIGTDLNLVTSGEEVAYSKDECINTVCELTKDFSMESGTLVTIFQDERDSAVEELEKHYKNVTSSPIEKNGANMWKIEFSEKVSTDLEEDLTESETTKCTQLIDELQGELEKCLEIIETLEASLKRGGVDTSEIHRQITEYLIKFVDKNNKSDKDITVEKIKGFLGNTTDEKVQEGLDTLTEDDTEIIEEEDGPQWKVEYTFEDGETATTTVVAENAEDSLKFATQYALKMSREDDKWKSAEVTSTEKVTQ